MLASFPSSIFLKTLILPHLDSDFLIKIIRNRDFLLHDLSLATDILDYWCRQENWNTAMRAQKIIKT